MHRRPVGRPLALLVSLCLVVTACSSSGGATDGTTDEASPTTAAAPTTVAPARAVDEATLQAFADQLVTDNRADGGIVAWRVGDDQALVVTAGVADARTGQVIETSDAFDVASITKSFVAATLVLLADEGAVDLDDPLADFVADWPNAEAITIRQLLDHTSGVAAFGSTDDVESDRYLARVAQGGSESIDETLSATRDLPPADEPGASTTYSNLNYVLAGAVIEDVTGEGIGAVFEARLFGPLGMDDTWYLEPATGDPQPLPGLHEIDPAEDPLSTTEIPMDAWRTVSAPAVGTVSTVGDLLAWSDAVLRAHEVDGVDVSAMTDIAPGGYGLGVVGVTADGACIFNGGCEDGATFTHWGLNGDIPGSSTRLLHDPETDATLLVYLNRNFLSLDDAMLEFLEG